MAAKLYMVISFSQLNDGVSPYVAVAPGDIAVSSSFRQASVEAAAGKFYSAILTETGVVTIGSADAADTRKPVLLTAPRDPVRVGEANRQLARLGIRRLGTTTMELRAAME